MLDTGWHIKFDSITCELKVRAVSLGVGESDPRQVFLLLENVIELGDVTTVGKQKLIDGIGDCLGCKKVLTKQERK